jgi:hypothetical protein
MKKKTAIILLFSFYFLNCFAQNRFGIRYEVGVEHTKYFLQNPQQNVEFPTDDKGWIDGGYVGFSFFHSINSKLNFETGIYDKYYSLDIHSYSPDTTHLVVSLEKIQIPLRIQYKEGILKNRIVFNVSSGVSLGFKNSLNNLYYLSNQHQTWEILNEKVPKTIIKLFELGLGVDFFLGKRFNIGLQYRKNFGLKSNQIDHHIKILRPDNTLTEYFINSDGRFNSFTISIGFAFNYKLKNKKVKEK